MNRPQLEHLIRAAAGNADTTDLVVIGSQSILGTYPDAPDELLVSNAGPMGRRLGNRRSLG